MEGNFESKGYSILMKVENFYRALHTQGGIRLKAHKQIHFGTLDIKEKDYKKSYF